MDYPKRLIEVDLPIKRISAHARREKSIRHGHISTLHIWWARRPLAACRAVICAALWPDPADEKCPPAFRDEARRLMTDWAANHLDLTSPESMSRFNRVKNDPNVLTDHNELRKSLLDFIADFADWHKADNHSFVEYCGEITRAAHEALGGETGTRPLVVDPFAGGGSIPLEALRVGADSFASDLNPIPVVLNQIALKDIQRFGQTLADEIRKWGDWVSREAAGLLDIYYSHGTSAIERPIAYLWARTVRCESPACDVRIPLCRSVALDNKSKLAFGLRVEGSEVLVDLPAKPKSFGPTIKGGAAICPRCEQVLPATRVRAQLAAKAGGATDAQLLCTIWRTASGLHFRLPTPEERAAAAKASEAVSRHQATACDKRIPLPEASISRIRPAPNSRGVSPVTAIGITRFVDLFTPRQLLAQIVLTDLVSRLPAAIRDSGCQNEELARATTVAIACAVDRLADYNSSLCTWVPSGGFIGHAFTKQALSNVWDFAEVFPFSNATGSFQGAVEWVASVVERTAFGGKGEATVVQADARKQLLPDDSVDAFITDPPYYSEIPYADISDFFYIWMRRSLAMEFPQLFASEAVDRTNELIVTRSCEGVTKDFQFFEQGFQAFSRHMRVITKPSGIGVIVFANAKTEAWEAMLQAVVSAGLQVTASWAIDTEMANRTRARNASSLQSSIHLVCRPRENPDGTVVEDSVGDWRIVLTELPSRIHSWMSRLADEGVVGADAIFACIGPALEIFSRYSRVEKASGDVVTLREYLEQVWAAVSTEALSMIFRDADAADLESDARFTAIVLWTIGAGGSSSTDSGDGEVEVAEDEGDEEELPKGKAEKGGYTLEYDAARKIAQGLGVNLEQIDSVVEVKGDKARLLPVSERAAMLFGKAEKAEVATKKRGKKATQKKLFDRDSEEGSGKTETVTLGDGVAVTPGITALDRVHQAMLLFAGGRADALKRFVVEDGVGGDARFWKLAQSLSALYPAGSDEKRWVDGVLARKKTFGF